MRQTHRSSTHAGEINPDKSLVSVKLYRQDIDFINVCISLDADFLKYQSRAKGFATQQRLP
jgi:hypothetical protein